MPRKVSHSLTLSNCTAHDACITSLSLLRDKRHYKIGESRTLILCLHLCPLVAFSIQSTFAFGVRGHSFSKPLRSTITKHSCTRLALVYPQDYSNESNARAVVCRRVHVTRQKTVIQPRAVCLTRLLFKSCKKKKWFLVLVCPMLSCHSGHGHINTAHFQPSAMLAGINCHFCLFSALHHSHHSPTIHPPHFLTT